MNSTNNNTFQNAAKKVFAQLGQLIEEDEKLNNNHVYLHELPNDIMGKINNNLLDKNDKRFNKIFNDSKDYKLLKILFGNNIPSRKQLKYIDPDIYNEYKTNINRLYKRIYYLNLKIKIKKSFYVIENVKML